MKKNTKKKLVLAVINVLLCVVLLNIDHILPTNMSNTLEVLVFAIRVVLITIMLFIFWYVCIYTDPKK